MGEKRLKPPVFGVQKVGKGLSVAALLACWSMGEWFGHDPGGGNTWSSGGLMSEAAFLCVFVQKMVKFMYKPAPNSCCCPVPACCVLVKRLGEIRLKVWGREEECHRQRYL